jgi:hypothetical protein
MGGTRCSCLIQPYPYTHPPNNYGNAPEALGIPDTVMLGTSFSIPDRQVGAPSNFIAHEP